MWPVLTRDKIVRRDGEYCPHCGATNSLTIQHRIRKGAGGSNDAERPSNGIMLCWAFNVAIEQDADQAAYARSCGWKLTTADDPTAVPVYDATTGDWWLLDDGWNRRPA